MRLIQTWLFPISVLLATALSIGCDGPYLRNPKLVPTQEKVQGEQGEALVDHSRDGVTTALTFHTATAGTLEFTLKVTNNSGEDVEVVPEGLRLKVLGGPEAVPVIAPAPPESVIAGRSQISIRTTYRCPSCTIRPNPNFRRNPYCPRNCVYSCCNPPRPCLQPHHIETWVPSLEKRRVLEKLILTKNTLKPGSSVEGVVVFVARACENNRVQVEVPLGERTSTFEFLGVEGPKPPPSRLPRR